METWAWNELEAQVEDNGHGPVTFYLNNSGPDGEDLELDVVDIKFEDNQVKVILE